MFHKSKKGPLLFVTALFFATPICMAQAALSSDAAYAGSLLQQRLTKSQTEFQKLLSSLPKTSQDLLSRPFSSLPSADDISSIENILADYKTELKSIQQEINNLPKPSATLQDQLDSLTQRIQSLESSIEEIKSIRSAYLEHQQTLQEAIQNYNQAVLDEQKIQRDYETLLAANTSNQDAATQARSSLTSKEATLTTAQSILDTAKKALDSATEAKDRLTATANISQNNLTDAIQNYNTASTNYSSASIKLQQAHDDYTFALESYNNGSDDIARSLELLTNKKSLYQASLASFNLSQSLLQDANTSLQEAQDNLNTANASLNTALDNLATASANLQSATQAQQTSEINLFQTQQSLNNAQATSTSTASNLQNATSIRASKAYKTASALAIKNTAQQHYLDALDALSTAQTKYDTELISDPNWTPKTQQVAHTRFFPQTTYVNTGGLKADSYNRQNYGGRPPLPTDAEVPIATTTVSNINFQWGGGQVLNSGKSDRVLVKFTGNLLVPTDGYYRFYAPGDDGVIFNIAGMQIINDWYDKGGGGSVSQEVFIRAGVLYPITLYFYENGGGAAVWLYYYTPTTGYQIVPASWLGQQTTSTTTYVEETYYTTEVIPGQTAPLIHDPAKLELLNQAQATYNDKYQVYLSALSNFEAAQQEDSAAERNLALAQAEYDAATIDEQQQYDAVAQAQLDYDLATSNLSTAERAVTSAMLAVTNPSDVQSQKQVNYEAALAIYNNELTNLELAQEALDDATSNKDVAQSNYNALLEALNIPADALEAQETNLSNAQSEYDAAELDLDAAFTELNNARAINNINKSALTDAVDLVASTSSDYADASTNVEARQKAKDDAVALLTVAENNALASQQQVDEIAPLLVAAKASVSRLFNKQETVSSLVSSTEEQLTNKTKSIQQVKSEISTDALPSLKTFVSEEVNKQAIPTEGSKEIPVLLTPENLMEINLKKVDPTELTEAQAEQLVAAALETFKTAEQGSAEYKQALDALYLAAEQDDIELSPELAAIPGAEQVVAVLNLISNVGADMSPKVRKKAQQTVVTTVVVGQIAASAAAAASASASSGSSSLRRKTGK